MAKNSVLGVVSNFNLSLNVYLYQMKTHYLLSADCVSHHLNLASPADCVKLKPAVTDLWVSLGLSVRGIGMVIGQALHLLHKTHYFVHRHCGVIGCRGVCSFFKINKMKYINNN